MPITVEHPKVSEDFIPWKMRTPEEKASWSWIIMYPNVKLLSDDELYTMKWQLDKEIKQREEAE